MYLLRTSGKRYSEHLIIKMMAKFLTVAREVSYKGFLWTGLYPPKIHMSKSLPQDVIAARDTSRISKKVIK